MLALPPAPAAPPRRQIFVATALACAAGTTLVGGLVAMWLRFRTRALDAGEGWVPRGSVVPEVPTNVMLLSFLGIGIFAQWAVYAARRAERAHTTLALALVALLGLAVVNGQAYVYTQFGVPVAEGPYGPLFYATTGVFLALMIVGIVFSGVAIFRVLGGRPQDREILSAHAMYWYFLAAAYSALWLVIYVTK